jgi:hypothetical protein
MFRKFLSNYLPRHRNRTNRLLHLIGVPLSFVAPPIFAVLGYPWYVHVGCFVGGYVLQFAGHAVEGNDAGEVVFFKRMLGLPYNEYAQDSNGSSLAESTDDTKSAVK